MEDNSSEDFLDWKVYLEKKKEDALAFDPLHWYLAQLAREIVVSRNPKRLKHLKIKDFLLKFVNEAKTEVKTEAELKAQVAKSKAHWKAVMGRPKQEPPTNGRRTRT